MPGEASIPPAPAAARPAAGGRRPAGAVSRWLGRVSLAGWLAYTVVPLAILAVGSVAWRWFYPALLPGEWTLRGWAAVAAPGSGVAEAAANSTLIAAGATALSLLVGYPAGRALGLHRFPGRRLVFFLLLLPQIVPPIAYAMGVHGIFLRLGLADTLGGLMLVHVVPCLPYVVISLTSQFANYPVEMEEQARTLGAPPWRVFVSVTLPAVRPGLLLGALLSFLVSWSQYLLNLLIGGGAVPTLPELVFAFLTGSDTLMMATTALVFVLPPMALIVLLARLGMESSPARYQP